MSDQKKKIECHAEGETCYGCPHYFGKQDVCTYADEDYRSQVNRLTQELQQEREKTARLVEAAERVRDVDCTIFCCDKETWEDFCIALAENTEPQESGE